MKIIAVSDTHLHQPAIPECDLLIHSGDLTFSGTEKEVDKALQWLGSVKARRTVLVAGNHDWLFERQPNLARMMCDHYHVDLLQDDLIHFEGYAIYGTPWQPEFCNWAFNMDRDSEELAEKVNRIPDFTEILVTHGPPMHVLDRARNQPVGCRLLADRIKELAGLKLHVFGHIHECYGITMKDGVLFVNASHCTPGYRGENAPVTILM